MDVGMASFLIRWTYPTAYVLGCNDWHYDGYLCVLLCTRHYDRSAPFVHDRWNCCGFSFANHLHFRAMVLPGNPSKAVARSRQIGLVRVNQFHTVDRTTLDFDRARLPAWNPWNKSVRVRSHLVTTYQHKCRVMTRPTNLLPNTAYYQRTTSHWMDNRYHASPCPAAGWSDGCRQTESPLALDAVANQ